MTTVYADVIDIHRWVDGAGGMWTFPHGFTDINKGVRQPTVSPLGAGSPDSSVSTYYGYANGINGYVVLRLSGNATGTVSSVIIWWFGDLPDGANSDFACSISADDVTYTAEQTFTYSGISPDWYSKTFTVSWTAAQANQMYVKLRQTSNGNTETDTMYAEMTATGSEGPFVSYFADPIAITDGNNPGSWGYNSTPPLAIAQGVRNPVIPTSGSPAWSATLNAGGSVGNVVIQFSGNAVGTFHKLRVWVFCQETDDSNAGGADLKFSVSPTNTGYPGSGGNDYEPEIEMKFLVANLNSGGGSTSSLVQWKYAEFIPSWTTAQANGCYVNVKQIDNNVDDISSMYVEIITTPTCANALSVTSSPYTTDLSLPSSLDVYWTLTPAYTGAPLTVSTSNALTNCDTLLTLYSGSCGSLSSLTSNDNGGTVRGTSLISAYSLTFGTTYYIKLDNLGGYLADTQGSVSPPYLTSAIIDGLIRLTISGPVFITASGFIMSFF